MHGERGGFEGGMDFREINPPQPIGEKAEAGERDYKLQVENIISDTSKKNENDEFKEGVGIDKNKSPEIGQKILGEKVRGELRNISEINSRNAESVAAGIIERLNIISERDKNLVEAKVGVRANIFRNMERIKSCDKEEKKKIFRDFALEDAKWMQRVSGCVTSIKENGKISKKVKQEEIRNVWKELEEVYRDYGTTYKDFEVQYENYGYDSRKNKRGILGQVAAEGLFKEAGELMRKADAGDIVVKPTTPEDDVDRKIDLIIEIRHKNGWSKKIPCQIKSSLFTSRSANFIIKNLITSIRGDFEGNKGEDGLFSDMGMNYFMAEEKMRNKMAIFRSRTLKNFDQGLFIIIPHGKASQKRRGKESELLDDSGEVEEAIKKEFFRQLGEKVLGIDISKNMSIISNSRSRKEENRK